MHETVGETKNNFKQVSRNHNQRNSRDLSRPVGVPSSRQLGDPEFPSDIISDIPAGSISNGRVAGPATACPQRSATISRETDSVLSQAPPVPAVGDGLAGGVACVSDTTILTRDPGRAGGFPDIQPNNKGVLRREAVPLKGGLVNHNRLTPGYGHEHPSCQDVRFQIVCPEDINHYHRLARYNCHRPACPKCWSGWAARAADDAAARVEGYRDATGKPVEPRHITFSPPPGSVETLEDLYDRANRVMRLVGIEAAMVIPHPYRLSREGRERVPLRSWENRYTEALSSSTWRDRVVFSPHIHAIVYGPLPAADLFHKLTGWVYRNHDERGRGRAGDELRGTIYYLLTHAWVNGNNAVVRYWFGMNNHTLRKIPGETYKITEPCPVCQKPCRVIPPDIQTGTGPPVPFYQDVHNAPVHLVKVKTWEYIIWSDRKPEKEKGVTALAGSARALS